VCQSFVASQHEYEELPDRACQGLDKSGVENIRDIFCNNLQLEPAALQWLFKGHQKAQRQLQNFARKKCPSLSEK
jgi:hypothetical protein